MRFTTLAIGLSALALATAANAAPTNLVVNGGFEQLEANAATGQYHICDNTQPTCVSVLTGWSATAGTGGTSSTSTPGSVLLGGNGGSEWNSGLGLYGPVPNSPDGGNFIGIDGDPDFTQTIFQTISGLTVGHVYALTFYQSAAQQQGLTGPTTEQWQVSLGGDTQLSTNQFNPSQSFLPWTWQSLKFTASSASEVLTFLALGTPGGAPPVVLLDGVSLVDTTTVPEAATLGLLGLGLGLVGIARRRK